jgi:hypothetical protein
MAAKYEIYDEIQKMIFYRQTCNDMLSGRHGRHVGILLNRGDYNNLNSLIIRTRQFWEDVFTFTLIYCFEKANVNMNVSICLFTCFIENDFQFLEQLHMFENSK